MLVKVGAFSGFLVLSGVPLLFWMFGGIGTRLLGCRFRHISFPKECTHENWELGPGSAVGKKAKNGVK